MKHRSPRKAGFQPTSLIAAALLLLLVFISVGYFFFLTEPRLSADQQAMLEELQLRRSEWLEKRPPAFRYDVQRECECPLDYTEPFHVIEYLDDADNQSWIDNYFDQLELAIASDDTHSIRYDPRYSYPNDFQIADEQVFIRDFEVLQYD